MGALAASMMNKPFFLFVIIFGLFDLSCDSNQKGYTYSKLGPKDSLSTFHSSNLLLANEPILSKEYLGYEVYRFDWFRSFHAPVFISIYKDDQDYWLTVRKLDKSDYVTHEGMEFVIPENATEQQKKEFEEVNRQIRASKIPPKIEIDRKVKISENEWNEFLGLLKNCNYWQMEP